MSNPINAEFDVVVVGGGPSGSTVSTLVAMQGHRVLLLEKEKFPRYQIGESLLPATIHGICKILGVSEELKNAGFPIKRGGSFRWGKNPEPWEFSFSLSSKFVDGASTAYQVERMKFDQILLDNARRKGVEVREEASVADVIEEDGRVVGVRYTDADGREHEVRSRYLVDASGNKSRIHGRIGGRRVYSEFFRNLALFGYFEGGKRMPAPNEGNILAVAFEAGWFWYIPLSPTLTSVGVVLLPEELERVQGDQEKALLALIDECPLIAEYLAGATRVTEGTYGEVRVRKDYSYVQEKFWRPGMVLSGDAACFIDPVFSQGVHLATYGGLLAARSLNTALAGDVPEQAAFEEFETRYRMEYARFHDFLVAFYDMHQDEDSYFWKAKKVTRNAASHVESFVELVGGGASHELALVDADSYVSARSAAFEELSEIVDRRARGEAENHELLKSALIRSVAKEGHRIQAQAVTGSNLDEQVPIRPGGLVPSTDGLHWSVPALQPDA
ncbi:tryptophan 7-halogenase [Dactylosporangium sp. NPDC049140]|uniref:tryptophan 7-halogenase n=1 Tax=Dactylosporangium sp. NPDC049140 TaxID=3155647 RepID=UPI0033F57BAF